MDLEPPKGTRDFLAEEKLLRDRVKATLERVFQRFGYAPLETPAIENWEVLASKYAGGEEILKETYRFKDRGDRDVGLRYDQTVPTCRVLAANPRLPMPYKRYQIQPVWRDGPLKVGRYREFYQCDIDIFGVQSQVADAETIAVIEAGFEALGLDCVLKLNNRKILNGILDHCGVKKEDCIPAILSLDKLEKIGAEEVQKEMEQKGIPQATARKVLKLFFSLDGLDNEKTVRELGKLLVEGEGAQGVAEMQELLSFLDLYGVDRNFCEIRVTLARGLSYYNSSIYEAFLRDGSITSSVCGCGRYDNLVGNFSGKEKLPATGGSFGFEVICEVLKMRDEKMRKTVVEAFVIPIKAEKQAFRAAAQLRALGVHTSVDLLTRSVSRNLEYCSKQAIPFAVIVGEKEAKEGKVTLRDLASGKEELVGADEAAGKILAAREKHAGE